MHKNPLFLLLLGFMLIGVRIASADESIVFTGKPSANIGMILKQMPQDDWKQFCSLPQVLDEIKSNLKAKKGFNIASIANIKQDHVSSGLINEYACNVQITDQKGKSISGIVTINYDKKKDINTTKWDQGGLVAAKEEANYYRKQNPQLQAFCFDQKVFAGQVANFKQAGAPYELVQQEAANYDQNRQYRDNLNAAQAGTPWRRVTDPVSAVNIERTRLAVVDLAYKNPNAYKGYAGGLQEYVFDKCMGN